MIINVSGFGWSGSGAVYDLLKEFDDVKIALTKCRDSEFCLLYDVDGLCDLEHHVMDRSCRISSYVAIQRYLDLVKAYILYFDFEKDFGGKFYTITEKYINDIVDFEFRGSTYFELLTSKSPTDCSCIQKLSRKRYIGRIIRKFYKEPVLDISSDIRVSYKPKQFLERTRQYINELFNQIENAENLPLVFDQLIPPDNPEPFIKYVPSCKCIFVRRDPRDLYIFVKKSNDPSIPIPVNTVDNFITFYRKIIQETKIYGKGDYLEIQFEDLIYNYNQSIKAIENFLGIKEHSRQFVFFNPEISKKNTGLYINDKEYADDIIRIEESLSDSLFPFANFE